MTASTAPPFSPPGPRSPSACSCSCHSSVLVLAPLRRDGVPGSGRRLPRRPSRLPGRGRPCGVDPVEGGATAARLDEGPGRAQRCTSCCRGGVDDIGRLEVFAEHVLPAHRNYPWTSPSASPTVTTWSCPQGDAPCLRGVEPLVVRTLVEWCGSRRLELPPTALLLLVEGFVPVRLTGWGAGADNADLRVALAGLGRARRAEHRSPDLWDFGGSASGVSAGSRASRLHVGRCDPDEDGLPKVPVGGRRL